MWIRLGADTLPPTFGVDLVVLGLERPNRWSWTSPITIALLLSGVVSMAEFVHIRLGGPTPLLDIRHFSCCPLLGNVVMLGLPGPLIPAMAVWAGA